MRSQWILSVATATTFAGLGISQAPKHFNPMIDLHIAKKPVFGLYMPSNPRAGRGGGRGGPGAPGGAPPAVQTPPPAPVAVKTPAELVADAFAYQNADFIFDGSMEGDFDRGYASFGELTKAMIDAGAVNKSSRVLHHPLVVKTPEIAKDTVAAKARIAKQLNMGVSTVVFVGVESADEVKTGLAAMRFKSKGGTRPDDVGSAPAFWGMSEAEYRQKADLWPLNPNGEITNWTIVESKEGLKHVREIAAVKGIGVLFPGAGTLRGVFSTPDSTGRRIPDPVAWEAAIQQVLAACKEFNVPCGYPANDPQQVEERMKQGFSVFIANWGDNGFKAVEHGKKLSGR